MLSWFLLLDIGLGSGLRNKLANAIALDEHKKAQEYVSTAYFTITIIAVAFIAFMLTDGQATSGERDIKKLIERACKIPDTVQLELIGYGADHDFKLLKGIQQARPNTGYRFIAEFEKSAFACSEIIYRLLNRIAKNIKIHVQNGEIYNWKDLRKI